MLPYKQEGNPAEILPWYPGIRRSPLQSQSQGGVLYEMASDPRVSKPRLLKAYSDSQLTFLKRYIYDDCHYGHNIEGINSHHKLAVICLNLNANCRAQSEEMQRNSLWK